MRPYSSDARLVRRAAEGEERAFAAIYRRYDQPLYRYCLSIVGNAEDAQDALQNTMVKVMRALPGEQREIKLKPWLYRIAHNESVELLRRRREQVELGPDLASPAGGPAEAAALRERLRRLLGDIAQLPERQRGALLMRELGDLDFEQIAAVFDTSAAVARQTLYEARLSLGQLQAGREMSCEKVMRELSDGDGRVTRRREIQAHLRECTECREFGESIATRRRDLAAIAPLPAAASGALLHAVLGGGDGAAGLGGAGAAAGAGKAAIGSVAVKSAATVAVAVTLGASVADRSGLIDVTGSKGDPATGTAQPANAHGPAPSEASGPPFGLTPHLGGSRANGDELAVPSANAGNPAGTRLKDTSAGARGSAPPGASAGPAAKELPSASAHGQETAASHGGGRAQAGSKAGGNSRGQANSHSKAPSKPPGHSRSQAKPDPGAKPPPSHPSHPPAPPAKGVGPDNSPAAPLQPSESPHGKGLPEDAGNPPSKEAR